MSTLSRTAQPRTSPELGAALSACKTAFVGVGLTSGLMSLLYLNGSFYMLEIYDRVIPSRSIPTLVGVSVLAAVLYAFQGLLDLVRGRILVRVGAALDARLGRLAFNAAMKAPLKFGGGAQRYQPLRDLEHVRAFLSSIGLAALFDLPWMPVYLAICFFFHSWIGYTAVIGGIILVSLTILNDRRTQGLTKSATEIAIARNTFIESSRRNAEVAHVLGMTHSLADIWAEMNGKFGALQQKISDRSGGIGTLSRTLRMVLQSAVLGIGGYLVIDQQASGGIIIASSILVARALAPVDQAIAHWKNFITARQGWQRLGDMLANLPAEADAMELPAPQSSLSVEAVTALPPGTQRPTALDVSFSLSAGSGLGIVGPSASGKSSLARVLVGAWAPARGKVRLDNAALEQWPAAKLGRHIGYLPQDVELFAGSVAQNIARFEPQPDAQAVLAAARAAGVHDLILRLPNGYETQVGEGGTALSAGQRQRIALARALYRDPFLLVLDEPNSNLDADGDAALNEAVMKARQRGAIVIVIAHRQSVLTAVDQMMVLSDGRLQAFGPKDEVLAKMQRRPAALTAVAAQDRLRVVEAAGARS